MEKSKTSCVILGTSKGVSKKNEKPFYTLQIGIPYPSSFTDAKGYMAKTIYLDSEKEYDVFKNVKPCSIMDVELLYFNGVYKVITA